MKENISYSYAIISDNSHIKYEDYEDFIYKVFEYFNGKVNKKLAQKISICLDPVMGGWNDGSEVVIFIDNVVENNRRFGDDRIRTMLIWTIAHELAHIDQTVDYPRYHSDENYRTDIEYYADYTAYKFLINNYGNIILDLFRNFDGNKMVYHFNRLLQFNITNNTIVSDDEPEVPLVKGLIHPLIKRETGIL